jgi:hypothetical protein
MTLLWFIVWAITSIIDGTKPLRADPVNAWTWTLILAVALDLASLHAPAAARSRPPKAGRDAGER